VSRDDLAASVHELHPKRDRDFPIPETWRPVDMTSVSDLPPRTPDIGGLLYPGLRHVLYGKPESGKTWAALCLALTALRQGLPVLFIDWEMDSRDAYTRLTQLGASVEQMRKVYYLQPEQRITPDELRWLIGEYAPGLIVFDSLEKLLSLYGLKPNPSEDIAEIERLVIDPIKKLEVAMAIIDHARRSDGLQAGSQRKRAMSDVLFKVRAVTTLGIGRTGVISLHGEKDRHSHLKERTFELQLHSNEDGQIEWQFTEASRPVGRRSAELVEQLRELLAEGGTHSIRQMAAALDCRQASASRAADALVAEGYAVETPGAKRARLFSKRNAD